ncbi:hypothetical protein POM88_036385 [Heracleum sosnowskyi]|uniref:Uncharacterized protein n=1 Tax=Heracleum sosnowskyi TaxID=360622 RepID=A0AAD8MFK7_9APIA|nr:hypothetical protein POM88_036385 [Heracleum sosnowskyi]
MRRRDSSSLVPLDLEIERTAKQIRKQVREAKTQVGTMGDNVDEVPAARRMRLESLSVDRHQPVHPAQQVQNVHVFCDTCGEGHPTQQCPLIYHDASQSNTVNYVGNSNDQEKCFSVRSLDDEINMHMTEHNTNDPLELPVQEVASELNALPSVRKSVENFESSKMLEKSKAEKSLIEDLSNVKLGKLPSHLNARISVRYITHGAEQPTHGVNLPVCCRLLISTLRSNSSPTVVVQPRAPICHSTCHLASTSAATLPPRQQHISSQSSAIWSPTWIPVSSTVQSASSQRHVSYLVGLC